MNYYYYSERHIGLTCFELKHNRVENTKTERKCHCQMKMLQIHISFCCCSFTDLWALESAYKRSKMGRVSESVWTCTFLLLFVFLTSVPQANAQGTTCQTVRFIGYFFGKYMFRKEVIIVTK